MCVYKVPAANDPQVFLYGVLKSAILGVFWGGKIRRVFAQKTVVSVVVHSALSSCCFNPVNRSRFSFICLDV